MLTLNSRTRSARSSRVIQAIVDSAKTDRRGVYWPLAKKYSHASSNSLEISLGYGTAGVVLALLAEYQVCPDEVLQDLIIKGTSWIAARLKGKPFTHGFFVGSTGVWRVFKEVEKSFPGAVPNWRESALRSIDGGVSDATNANYLAGISGSILGVLFTLDLDGDDKKRIIAPLARQLVGIAKPHAQGIYWDFCQTSRAAPCGLILGSAGPELALALVKRETGISYSSILDASLNYSDSHFSEEKSNWLDLDQSIRMQKITPEAINKAIKSGSLDGLNSEEYGEDSLSWGAGLIGILQSRLAVVEAYRGTELEAKASLHLDAVEARLSTLREAEARSQPSDVMLGLPGMFLGIRAMANAQYRADTRLEALVCGAIDSQCKDGEIDAPDFAEDMSFLTGYAGGVYCDALRVRPESPTILEEPPRSCSGEVAMSEESTLPFLQKNFPLSAEILAISEVPATELNLGHLKKELTFRASTQPAPGACDVIAHEVSFHEELSETCFQDLFWSELMKQKRVGEMSACTDDSLLFLSMQLDPSCRIIELRFDPAAKPIQIQDEPTYVLRHRASTGVMDNKLSSLQFALLHAFARQTSVIAAVVPVIRRVCTPNVSLKQLAMLSLRIIRSFVQSGALTPVKSSQLSYGIDRLRWRREARELFAK